MLFRSDVNMRILTIHLQLALLFVVISAEAVASATNFAVNADQNDGGEFVGTTHFVSSSNSGSVKSLLRGFAVFNERSTSLQRSRRKLEETEIKEDKNFEDEDEKGGLAATGTTGSDNANDTKTIDDDDNAGDEDADDGDDISNDDKKGENHIVKPVDIHQKDEDSKDNITNDTNETGSTVEEPEGSESENGQQNGAGEEANSPPQSSTDNGTESGQGDSWDSDDEGFSGGARFLLLIIVLAVGGVCYQKKKGEIAGFLSNFAGGDGSIGGLGESIASGRAKSTKYEQVYVSSTFKSK